jgi:predicted nucleic acid-binding protein
LNNGEARIVRVAANQQSPCFIIINETPSSRAKTEIGIAVTKLAAVIIVATKKQLIPTIAKLFAHIKYGRISIVGGVGCVGVGDCASGHRNF